VNFIDPSGQLPRIAGCSTIRDGKSIDYWVTFALKPICEGNKNRLDVCLRTCNKHAKTNVKASCIAQFCKSGSVTCLNCSNTSPIPCPTLDCTCKNKSATLADNCGQQNCSAPMPRPVVLCTNSGSEELLRQCQCTPEPGIRYNCDVPAVTVLHELAHACSDDCSHDETNNDKFGNCMLVCMTFTWPGMLPPLP